MRGNNGGITVSRDRNYILASWSWPLHPKSVVHPHRTFLEVVSDAEYQPLRGTGTRVPHMESVFLHSTQSSVPATTTDCSIYGISVTRTTHSVWSMTKATPAPDGDHPSIDDAYGSLTHPHHMLVHAEEPSCSTCGPYWLKQLLKRESCSSNISVDL